MYALEIDKNHLTVVKLLQKRITKFEEWLDRWKIHVNSNK